VYGLLCAVSLGIAGGFAVHGAPWVLGFACIELTAVAAALLVWARHACDGETVTLGATHVDIERRIGGMTEHLRLPADWLRVDRDRGDLVRLGHGDRATSVGRFVPHARREGFVRELRDALAARRQP
jgi:uncharacterized membrane protein